MKGTLQWALLVGLLTTANAFVGPSYKAAPPRFLLGRPRTLSSKSFNEVVPLSSRNHGMLQSSRTKLATASTEVEDKDQELNQIPLSLPSQWLSKVYETAGPVAGTLDDVSSGYVLSYTDLRPETESSPLGVTFLATNLAYLVVGAYMTVQGDAWFGLWTEATAIFSFGYHYQQLAAAGNLNSPAVRGALLLDYVGAFFSIATALFYLVMCPSLELAIPAVGMSGLALGFLGMSWIYDQRKPYIVWHSLWHFASACAGYMVGNIHLSN